MKRERLVERARLVERERLVETEGRGAKRERRGEKRPAQQALGASKAARRKGTLLRHHSPH